MIRYFFDQRVECCRHILAFGKRSPVEAVIVAEAGHPAPGFVSLENERMQLELRYLIAQPGLFSLAYETGIIIESLREYGINGK